MQLEFLRHLIGAEKPQHAISKTDDNGVANANGTCHWSTESEALAALFKRSRL
nr:hypothetical protein [Roseobacter litoralis]